MMAKATGVLAGQTAIVTGGNRGIGKGIARAFAMAGADVLVTARDAALLESTVAELEAYGGVVVGVPADVQVEADVARVFAEAAARFERLDVLVNNAGLSLPAPLHELELESWETVIGTNLTGAFLCTRAAMRLMRAQGRGRIINIASISSQRVRPESASYSASKFGLWGLTQVTSLEGRDHGISACCINPGNTRVERREEIDIEENLEPMMGVESVAQVAVTMAALPPHVQLLEATVMPLQQPFIGRG